MDPGDLATWVGSATGVLAFAFVVWNSRRESRRADRAEGKNDATAILLKVLTELRESERAAASLAPHATSLDEDKAQLPQPLVQPGPLPQPQPWPQEGSSAPVRSKKPATRLTIKISPETEAALRNLAESRSPSVAETVRRSIQDADKWQTAKEYATKVNFEEAADEIIKMLKNA